MLDNHPRQRQIAKKRSKLERKHGKLLGKSVVLISCEGAKTEPEYFRGLINFLGIQPARVTIDDGTTETDARSVVKRAQQVFSRNQSFDRVFAVVDTDQHNLNAAKQLARKRLITADKKRIHVELIISNPCFEYWLLLHLVFTDRLFANCDEAIEDLTGQLPDYSKSDPLIFEKVKSGFDQSLINADKLKAALKKSGTTCPDTDMASLVRVLQEMQK